MRKYLITNHATQEVIIVEAKSAQEAAEKVGYRVVEVAVSDIGQPKLSGMTIDKGIEILDRYCRNENRFYNPGFWDSINLGIEALKVIRAKRGYPVYIIPAQLPGETKE